MNIKKGDKVLVIKGKDRGKTGIVSAVAPSTNRIKIEGLNIMKRHAKTRGRVAGGVIMVEGTINAANVMLIDPSSGKPTRVGHQTNGTQKSRLARVSKSVIEDVKK